MPRYSIDLPFPPSVNTYYRATKRGVLISAKGRKYKEDVSKLIKDPPLFTGNLHISAVLFPPDKRRRDLDNFDGKAIWDALTGAGVWVDDSQVKSRFSRWGEVIKEGKLVIVISEMNQN